MDVFSNDKAPTRADDEHEARIEDFTRCCLCGTELAFQHEVDYSRLSVREDAHCPSCRIRLRARDHALH